MTKYEPLKVFLQNQGENYVKMTFSEIEQIIGTPLPHSSKVHRAWWSNNPSNNVMTKEWLAAGYETEQVDIGAEKLVFRRLRKAPSAGAPQMPGSRNFEDADAAQPREYRSMFACMKGTLTVDPNYDVTAPLDVEWGEPYLGIEEKR